MLILIVLSFGLVYSYTLIVTQNETLSNYQSGRGISTPTECLDLAQGLEISSAILIDRSFGNIANSPIVMLKVIGVWINV